MPNIKEIAGIIIFIYCLNLIFTEHNTAALIILIIITLLFINNYTDLKKQEQKLIKNYKKISEENLKQQSNSFIEVLTHDIKIPTIAQLQGINILKSKCNDTAQRELLLQIEESCSYILEMISMLVNTYHIETNTHKLCYEKFNVSEVLNECFQELSKAANDKHLTFVLSQKNTNNYVEADKNDIKKVIKNLIHNAIKYSFTGSRINISIKCYSNSLKFTISGMDLNDYTTLDIFTSKPSISPIYTTIGQNISMYLTRKIIEFHKGKIYTSSQKKSNDTYTFIIPRFEKTQYKEKLTTLQI